jgi:hypothetical protein
MAEIKPIRLALHDANDLSPPAEPLLGERFAPIAAALAAACRQRSAGSSGSAGEATILATLIDDFLAVAARLDGEYGHDRSLPIADVADAADEALRALAELQAWLPRLDLSAHRAGLDAVTLGIGLWAMRHDLTLTTPEPLVNALAHRANEATTTQETAALYAMTQGLIAHFSPRLQADLERSNPERPWRLLNLNFAITAIRTGDTALMRFAFDTLKQNLPDESGGFFQEAHSVATLPGFPAESRALIEAELAQLSGVH